jgi:hypothetical protein
MDKDIPVALRDLLCNPKNEHPKDDPFEDFQAEFRDASRLAIG